MTIYNIGKIFTWEQKITDKGAEVMRIFGMDIDRLKASSIRHKCRIELGPGQVCFITGASGSGKSVLIKELYEQTAETERLWLHDIELETERSVVDGIEGDCTSALRILTKAGLSDVFSVLSRPDRLSDGQKYRYRLAKALSGDKRIIFADEFCENLDRITAAVLSHSIQKCAKQTGKIFVLASSHDDVLCDLRPEVIVIKYLNGRTEVIYRDETRSVKRA